MNVKRYRMCLLLLIMVVVAGSVIFYTWNHKGAEEPVDGMLVENCEMFQGENVA